MRSCRFLPVLILCCALDLAVPVALTASGGVEFEDDEEVIHLGARPAAEKATAETRHPRWSGSSRPQPGITRVASLTRRSRSEWQSEAVRTPQSRADAAGSAPPSGEDH